MTVITGDPEIMHGALPRHARGEARTLFDYLAAGRAVEDFLEDFPTVSRELALQALAEAHLELRPSGRSGRS